MKLNLIAKRKYFYIFSSIIFVASVISIMIWGLKLGIDFTGGSMLEVKYKADRPTVAQVETALKGIDLGDIKVQPAGDSNIILRFKNVDESTHQDILTKLEALVSSGVKTTSTATNIKMLQEEKFESIGPVIGEEIKHKAIWAVVLASFCIILFIAYTFRKVSKPVASWKYGTAAVLALIHDLVITTGVFVFLGHFFGIEVDSLFIVALLTVLGYSVNDTIVVFDRTRENLAKRFMGDFPTVVNESLNQTLVRSLNTTVTVLLALLALYFFGGITIHNFILALIIGITLGAYSSIFVASMLIVTWERWDKKRAATR